MPAAVTTELLTKPRRVNSLTESSFGFAAKRVYVDGSTEYSSRPDGRGQIGVVLAGNCERPASAARFAVDNSRIRELGLRFDADWRGVAREVIASLRADPGDA